MVIKLPSQCRYNYYGGRQELLKSGKRGKAFMKVTGAGMPRL
jgi:hypothetical protein